MHDSWRSPPLSVAEGDKGPDDDISLFLRRGHVRDTVPFTTSSSLAARRVRFIAALGSAFHTRSVLRSLLATPAATLVEPFRSPHIIPGAVRLPFTCCARYSEPGDDSFTEQKA